MTSPRTALLVAALALLPASAFAQNDRVQSARSLIRYAIQDYNNLEMDSALSRLTRAERACDNNACPPNVTAQIWMIRGVVQVQGQSDTAGGVASMVHALQIDASIEPDPDLVTPEITTAFNDARRQAGGGGRRPGNPPPTNNPPTSNPPAARGDLMHTPAPEQLENTPLPVYVEPTGPLNAAHVFVHYRSAGRTAYEQREMQRIANGYGTEIPCDAMLGQNISYYVSAVDNGGAPIASAGSESEPVRVNIVSRRTAPAFSLPGRLPPETCTGVGATECPPGMEGPMCHRGGPPARVGGLGDPCSRDAECGTDLHCDAGACGAGAPTNSEGPGDGPSTPSGPRPPRVSFDVGGGVGLAFLSGRPQYAERFDYTSGTTTGYTCSNYVCYTTIDPGFAPTYFLTLNARYNINNRFAVGAGVRFQFDAADWTTSAIINDGSRRVQLTRSNPFANLLISGRLYYAFTPNGFSSTGLVASAYVGGGGGQIEPKPALSSSVTQPGAHVVSGYGNGHVGARVEYGLRNGFHIAGEATFQFMFPIFLFNVDLAVLVGFHI